MAISSNRGVKGRAVLVGPWKAKRVISSFSSRTTPPTYWLNKRAPVKRGGFRVYTPCVYRSEIKFVRYNYEAKIERALKMDKAFRDFVEIAPCGVPCPRSENK